MRHAEPFAELDALDRGDAEHRLADIRLEFVEDRFAETRRHAARPHFDHAAERVETAARLFDALDHQRRHARVGAAHDIALDFALVNHLGFQIAELRRPAITEMPCRARRRLAIAPPATRPIVSRALLRRRRASRGSRIWRPRCNRRDRGDRGP